MRAFVLVLAVMMPLAGCSSVPEEIMIRAVRIGDSYTYVGDNDATLTVVVQGIESRRDPFFVSHESLVLAWAYTTPSPHVMTFGFEEAISLRTGRIVQQVALCGNPDTDSADGPWHCRNPRTSFYFAASGMIGGFGSSILWGRNVPEASVVVQVQAPEIGDTSITLSTTPSPRGRDCRLVTWSEDVRDLRALPWTLTSGNATLCNHSAFPVEFNAPFVPSFPLGKGTTHYGLRSSTVGKGPEVTVEDAPGLLNWPERPILLAEPFYVAGNDADLPFEISEAHRQAMNLSADYKSRADRGESVVAFRAWQGGSLEEPLLQYRQESTLATLGIADSMGNGIKVTLRKTVSIVAGQETPLPEFQLEGSEPFQVGQPVTINPRQVTLSQAWGLAESVDWGTLEVTDHMFTVETPRWPQWATHARTFPNARGYEVVFQAVDPNVDQDTGLVVYTPFEFVLDAPTGSLLWFDAPPGMTAF